MTTKCYFLRITAEFMPKVKKRFTSPEELLAFVTEFLDINFPTKLVDKKWPGYLEQVKDRSWHVLEYDSEIVPHDLFLEGVLPLEHPVEFYFKKHKAHEKYQKFTPVPEADKIRKESNPKNARPRVRRLKHADMQLGEKPPISVRKES